MLLKLQFVLFAEKKQCLKVLFDVKFFALKIKISTLKTKQKLINRLVNFYEKRLN